MATDYAALPRDEAAAAAARGATVLHDYGSFAWVAGSGQGASAQAVYALDLGGRRFDPASDAAARENAYGEGKALRLVQFDGPTRKAWLQALAANGVTVVQYVPPFSYVVWADAASLAGAKSRATAVRYTGDFLPGYKTTTVAAGLARGERHWQVMLYRGANLDAAALRATGVVAGQPVAMDARFSTVDVEGDAAAVEALARLPGVYTIQPVPRDGGARGELADQLSANRLASNLPVPGYLAWLETAGATGDGVKVADVDGGIYDTNPDVAGRLLPCVGDTCGGSAADAHGTHTAGIIAGDGSSGVVDAAGFLRGLGVAPGAKLIEQVYGTTFMQAGGMLKLMRQSHDNGADLSSNSWGPSATPRGYDLATRQVDVGVRDTKPDVAGDQPMTYVVSIMNGYGGTSSQGTPDEAKNTITVGSTVAQAEDTLAVFPNFNDISDNSGAGPALDGRRIPLVVAPGCSVDSTLTDVDYGAICGTSMAAPHVAGAAALLVEKYRDTHAGASPSAALVKAAIAASAQDLQGYKDADGGTLGHRPDSKQGWGRVRTDRLLDAGATLYYDQNTRTFGDTGEEWTTVVAPADPAKPMQVVLVWTDAPGHGLGGTTPAWNNDLDLVATVGATSYKGNVFGADGFSAAGGSADARNNVESVILPAGAAGGGAVSLRVAASNIVSDALPNAGDATDQDFALVCVNCTVRPDYTLTLGDARRAVCTATTGTAPFDVAVESLLGYGDPVTLSLAGLPAALTGSVSPPTVTPPGNAVATVGQLAAASPGTYAFQLHAVSTSATRDRDLALTLANAVPAAPSLASPPNAATNVALKPVFTWSAPAQAGDYVIEVATDANFANVVFTQAVQGTSATPRLQLESSTSYYWRVRAANACGTGATSAARRFTTLALAGDCPAGKTPSAVFEDTVENGTNGWTSTADQATYAWAITTVRAYRGTHAWLARDAGETSDQRLTSPAIALPTGRSPLTLRFMNDQAIEHKNGQAACWDGGFLEISTDGGASFTAVPPASLLTIPYDGPLDADNPAGGTPAWCGDPRAWALSVVNLDTWAGQSVRLRFRLTSDVEVGRDPDGWYLDDIKVQGCSADLIFANGFE